jgi:hypothetical protein
MSNHNNKTNHHPIIHHTSNKFIINLIKYTSIKNIHPILTINHHLILINLHQTHNINHNQIYSSNPLYPPLMQTSLY